MSHPVTRALVGALMIPLLALGLICAAGLYWLSEKFPRINF